MAEIGLMLAGGFYLYAGFVATRGALATAFFDRAMAQNAGRETPPLEALRTVWLVVGSATIALSGLTLVLLNGWAPYAFALGAVVQGSYLHVASPYLFAATAGTEQRDQRLARMAFMIYLATTLIVFVADRFGLLNGLGAVPTSSLALIAIIAAAIVGYGLWQSQPASGDDL